MQQSRVDFKYYLLNPTYKDYVSGKSDRLTELTDWATFIGMLVFSGFFVYLFISLVLAVVRDSQAAGELAMNNRAVILIFAGGAAAFLAYLAFSMFGAAILTDRRLVREGQLLPGTVTHVELKRGTRGVTGMQVDYELQNPEGMTITGTTIVAFLGKRPSTLPPQGTPVAILYVDDDLHRAL